MQKTYSRHHAKTISGTATLITTLIIVTPLCGFLFQCGCDWPWSGLDTRCNFYKPVIEHPCPLVRVHGNRHIVNRISHYWRCFDGYGANSVFSELSTRL